MRCGGWLRVPNTGYRASGERGWANLLPLADNFVYDLGEDLWDDQFGGYPRGG
jgi:hypothetical protein